MDQLTLVMNVICVAAFAAILLLAAVSDFRNLEIPNWMSITVALMFLPAGLSSGIGLWTMTMHIAVGLGILAVGAGVFTLGLIGGGDVKLLAATAMWFGLESLGNLLVGVVITGGMMALLILMSLRLPLLLKILGTPSWIDPDGGMKQPIPYGVAIAVASIAMIERIPVAVSWTHAWTGG